MKFLKPIVTVIALAFAANGAIGATNADYTELGKAAARYLVGIVMAQELAVGKCAWELADEAPLPTNLRAAKREVLLAFPRSYAPDLVKYYEYLDGTERLKAKSLVNNPKIVSAEDCKVENHYLGGVVENAVKDWEAAKARYGVR